MTWALGCLTRRRLFDGVQLLLQRWWRAAKTGGDGSGRWGGRARLGSVHVVCCAPVSLRSTMMGGQEVVGLRAVWVVEGLGGEGYLSSLLAPCAWQRMRGWWGAGCVGA